MAPYAIAQLAVIFGLLMKTSPIGGACGHENWIGASQRETSANGDTKRQIAIRRKAEDV